MKRADWEYREQGRGSSTHALFNLGIPNSRKTHSPLLLAWLPRPFESYKYYGVTALLSVFPCFQFSSTFHCSQLTVFDYISFFLALNFWLIFIFPDSIFDYSSFFLTFNLWLLFIFPCFQFSRIFYSFMLFMFDYSSFSHAVNFQVRWIFLYSQFSHFFFLYLKTSTSKTVRFRYWSDSNMSPFLLTPFVIFRVRAHANYP